MPVRWRKRGNTCESPRGHGALLARVSTRHHARAAHNRSWNCGEEGPTDNPDVQRLRNRQLRNFLATLFLSQGVPMLCGGDELGRTQQGNNTGYAQDNELSWYDWEAADESLLGFTRDLIKLRSQHPAFTRRRWFQGRPIRGNDVSDIGWFTPGGTEMSDQDWEASFARTLGVFLNGSAIRTMDERGRHVVDDSFYVMFNAHWQPVEFVLPASKWGEQWTIALDTNDSADHLAVDNLGRQLSAGEHLHVESWSLVLLRRVAENRT